MTLVPKLQTILNDLKKVRATLTLRDPDIGVVPTSNGFLKLIELSSAETEPYDVLISIEDSLACSC